MNRAEAGKPTMHSNTTRPVLAYGTAVLAVAGAILLRWSVDPLLGNRLALATLYGAVAVAVWYGGYRPALLATALTVQRYVRRK